MFMVEINESRNFRFFSTCVVCEVIFFPCLTTVLDGSDVSIRKTLCSVPHEQRILIYFCEALNYSSKEV